MRRFNPFELSHILNQPLGKRIDQRVVEKWAASFWDQSQTQEFPANGSKPFVMMLPPPNITGSLHLGHALTGAIQDALIRQRRISNHHSIWIPGFDHAGLATQNIVEKLLWHKQNITLSQLGREKFVELANEWKELKRSEMRDQLDRIGLNLAYDREYFTMDDKSTFAVHTAFKQLFNSGIIYRSVKPVFWSEELQTTLSDIEVEKIDGADRYVRTGELVKKRPISQWFINTNEMARQAVKVVQECSIEMIPPGYKRSWSSWLLENGVQDWCISRQSWWGHRIPAYKIESDSDDANNWIVADSIEEAKSILGRCDNVVQDPDVLDTWFSSSLLPLTVSGWPDTQKFSESCNKGLFPLDIMETGFDILTYWVSKMVMTSLALTGKIPFKLVLLHGMICDGEGKKMSKSRGNVIDPLDVIDGASLEVLQQRAKDSYAQGVLDKDQFDFVLSNQKRMFPKGIPACGADGLRAYLLSHDFQEEVVKIQISQIEKIRRLSNKIWNIFRFVTSLIQSQDAPKLDSIPSFDSLDKTKFGPDDKLILQQLSECEEVAHEAFHKSYQLHRPLTRLELFWTHQLSNEYIESIKNILFAKEGSKEDRQHKLEVLTCCLVRATKLMHPFMPHLTEFLYQKLVFELGKQSSGTICSLPNVINKRIT